MEEGREQAPDGGPAAPERGKRRSVYVVSGVATGCLLLWLHDRAAAGSLYRWILIAWVALALLPGLVPAFAPLRRAPRAQRPPTPRWARRDAWARLYAWGLTVLLAWIALREGAVAAPDLGLDGSVHPFSAFALGAAAYLPFLLAASAILPRVHGKAQLQRSFLRLSSRYLPRERMAKPLALAALTTNAFHEEIAYRGVLVKMLGDATLGPALSVPVGLWASTAAHFYQGRERVPFHLGFAGIAVALLYSPLGLWGCFGFHVMGDVLPWLAVPGVMRAYRAARRGSGAGPCGSAAAAAE